MPRMKATIDDSVEQAQVCLGPLKDHIAFQLRRAQDMSFQAFARRVGRNDLSPGHFTILVLINENPGVNQTNLSHATGRDKSTLTPALRELEGRGLVLRERSKLDRRAYTLNLTPAGRAHLDELMVHAQAHDRVLDAIVGAFHKPLLIHLLEQIVDGLSQDAAQATK